MATTTPLAPPWKTTEWLNTPEQLTLEGLRGSVVLLHAFQMLCPGCVSRGIPQAQRVAELFAGAPLVVVGLHAAFEHHQAMKVESLRVPLVKEGLADGLAVRPITCQIETPDGVIWLSSPAVDKGDWEPGSIVVTTPELAEILRPLDAPQQKREATG